MHNAAREPSALGMNGSNSQPSYSMVLAHQGMEPLDEIIAQMSRRMLNTIRQIDDPTHRERVGAMNVYSEFPDLRISLDGVVLYASPLVLFIWGDIQCLCVAVTTL